MIRGFEYKCICEWSKDDEFGFIPHIKCPAHGRQARKTLKKCVPIRDSSFTRKVTK